MLDVSECSSDSVNGISTLGIASDASVSDAIPPPLCQYFRSFCMIVSVHERRMADPRKVMWIKIFHVMCSGFHSRCRQNDFRRMLKKARLLTRPTPAVISPARPESARAASSPRDAPCPKQVRSSAADPRFTPHVSRLLGAKRERRWRTFSAPCE